MRMQGRTMQHGKAAVLKLPQHLTHPHPLPLPSPRSGTCLSCKAGKEVYATGTGNTACQPWCVGLSRAGWLTPVCEQAYH